MTVEANAIVKGYYIAIDMRNARNALVQRMIIKLPQAAESIGWFSRYSGPLPATRYHVKLTVSAGTGICLGQKKLAWKLGCHAGTSLINCNQTKRSNFLRNFIGVPI